MTTASKLRIVLSRAFYKELVVNKAKQNETKLKEKKNPEWQSPVVVFLYRVPKLYTVQMRDGIYDLFLGNFKIFGTSLSDPNEFPHRDK